MTASPSSPLEGGRGVNSRTAKRPGSGAAISLRQLLLSFVSSHPRETGQFFLTVGQMESNLYSLHFHGERRGAHLELEALSRTYSAFQCSVCPGTWKRERLLSLNDLLAAW